MFSKSWDFWFFSQLQCLVKKPKPRGQPWYVFLSCDWVAGAAQRPLNFTRTISAIHLITSVFIVFVPEKKIIQTLPRYSKASRTWTLKFPSRTQSTLCSRRAVVKPLEHCQVLKLKKCVTLSCSEFSMGNMFNFLTQLGGEKTRLHLPVCDWHYNEWASWEEELAPHQL